MGSSLIEILIATALVSVVLVSIATGLSYSVKSTSEAKYRGLATQKVQEIFAVFDRSRVLNGWSGFTSEFVSCISGCDYCVDLNPSFATTPFSSGSSCSAIEMAKINFIPEAIVTVDSATPQSVTVVVTVTWNTGKEHSVSSTKKFQNW